jgi:predicted metal-dependent hydrolase
MLETNPPLAYRIQEHPRARALRLKVSLDRGLEVVVPPGFDWQQIPAMVQQKQAWIEAARQKIAAQRQLCEPENLRALPSRIKLRAIDQVWQVEYARTGSDSVSIRFGGEHQLRIQGQTTDLPTCQGALRRWLQRMAQRHLIPWLEAKSQDAHLPFHKVVIRSQRTRWGSCSRHQTISLNSQLLFLPSHLVDYVLLHELCHTIHLNHSKAFWELVSQKLPDYRLCVQELHQAWRYVPLWTLSRHNC